MILHLVKVSYEGQKLDGGEFLVQVGLIGNIAQECFGLNGMAVNIKPDR